jgi:hypothetical protein
VNEKQHFSLADWDYDSPGPYISDAQAVSSPTSLAAKYTTSPAFNRQGWAMCKLATAQCITDGRIVNYIWLFALGTTILHFIYRAQANPASAAILPLNCYHESFTYGSTHLYRRIAGVSSDLGSYSFVPNLTVATWYRFRLTWWQYLQPDLTKMLRHTVEQEVAGVWVNRLTVDDSVNSFSTSAVNKCGFLLLHLNQINKIVAIDNSEIYKKVGT